MLESLRAAAGTWVAKLLLLLLVGSFAVWGISGTMLTDPAGGAVITAGKTEVSIKDYRLAYDRQVGLLSQQYGQRLTREQAQALGVDSQVLSQLVAGAVLDEQGRTLKLGVSQERLAKLVAEDPAFHGANGQYDRNIFDQVLAQVGMRPEDYLKSREQVAVRQQIVEAVTDGLDAPKTFLKAISLYKGEDRTIDFILLQPASVTPGTVTDEALATWFAARKADYAAPEYRKLAYVKLEPADISDPKAIADAQVRADYDKNISLYTTPEKRTIEQLVFKDQAAADLAAQSLKGGSTFEDIVKAEGKTLADVALGAFEKGKVPDPAVGEEAFKLTEGSVSGVITGAFGPIIIRVTKIEAEIVKTFDEVKEQIRSELALAEASRIILDVHDAFEDARAGGSSLAEAAAKSDLKVVTIEAIDRAATDPAGAVISTLPQSKELIAAAFETDVGVENSPLPIGSTGFVFYEVAAITPARDRTLDEIKDKVVADWTKEEAARLLAEKAGDAVKALKGGKSLADVAKDMSLEPQTKRGLKREAEDADIGAAGVSAVFSVKKGDSGTSLAASDGARVVFTVTEVTEPVGAGADLVPEEEQKAQASGISDDMLDELVVRLQTDYGVTINETAIRSALSF
ncbi:MAG: peptidyl-prolyl cis-trans isomerase [Rhizobiaceae bacterium]